MTPSDDQLEDLQSLDSETQIQDKNASTQVSGERLVVKALWGVVLRAAEALSKALIGTDKAVSDEETPPQPTPENTCLASAENTADERWNVSVRSTDEGTFPDPWRPYLRESEKDALIDVKLAAVRRAFELILRDPESKRFLNDTGKCLLGGLLTLAGKSTKGFGLVWEKLMAFTENPTNWPGIVQECQEAGMQTVDFYDIFYESIVLKVLECSEHIPDTLKPTLRTPWLSESTKKTTVMFYAWSQIKKKRQCSVRPDGLYCHLYELFDYIDPEIMWAAYGPQSNANDFYFLFKGQIMSFIHHMFNLDRDLYDCESPHLLSEVVLADWKRRLHFLQRCLEQNLSSGPTSPLCTCL